MRNQGPAFPNLLHLFYITPFAIGLLEMKPGTIFEKVSGTISDPGTQTSGRSIFKAYSDATILLVAVVGAMVAIPLKTPAGRTCLCVAKALIAVLRH